MFSFILISDENVNQCELTHLRIHMSWKILEVRRKIDQWIHLMFSLSFYFYATFVELILTHWHAWGTWLNTLNQWMYVYDIKSIPDIVLHIENKNMEPVNERRSKYDAVQCIYLNTYNVSFCIEWSGKKIHTEFALFYSPSVMYTFRIGENRAIIFNLCQF